MTSAELIDALEAKPSSAAALLRANTPMSGLSATYFDRIAERIGQSPEAALTLAKLWRHFLRYGDNPALAYRSKAAGERVQGKWLASAESFLLARKNSHGQEHSTIAIGAIDSLARGGKIKEAIALGKRLLRELEEDAVSAARARLNLGNAFLWADQYRLARNQLSQAAPILESAGRLSEAASARLGLSTALLDGGLARDALAAAELAAEYFDSAGLHYFASLARINAAHSNLLLGHADTALNLLLRLSGALSDSPPDLVRIREFLGDAYMALQMPSEAVASYTMALETPNQRSMPLNRANCEFGMGQALLALRRFSEGSYHLKRAGRFYRSCGNAIGLYKATLASAELLLATGKNAQARRKAKEAARLLQRAGASQHEVQGWMIAASCGDGAALVRAGRLIRQGYGTTREWQWHYLKASSTKGTRQMASFRKMADCIVRDRFLLSSAPARSSFLQDKNDALSEFVELLLSNPAGDHVQEALDLLRRTRAATLADELATSRRGSFPQAIVDQLDLMREEFALGEADPDGVRRSARHSSSRRAWIEATHELEGALDQAVGLQVRSTVFALGRNRAFKIEGNRAHRLPSSPREFTEKLDWVEFELSEPISRPTAGHSDLDKLLSELLIELQPSTEASICPEGTLWRVPWSLVPLPGGAEAVLALCPTFPSSAREATLKADPRVLLWKGRSEGLPRIDDEIEALRRIYPSAVVCDSAEAARESLSGEWDLFHVSAHAALDRENPMFSIIEFPDAPLFAADVAKSGLSVDLAILGACETGRVSVALTNEPDGWVRALVACGARAVVAAAWAVEDEASARTLLPLHQALSSGATLGRSLATGRGSCRAWRSHPFYWGPFVLFGGNL